MSEEEKMKLRYLREQKERAKQSLLGNVHTARKKTKFNLGSDDEEQDVMIGFTHKGRQLGQFEDDFKE
jgi:nucleolar protein 14